MRTIAIANPKGGGSRGKAGGEPMENNEMS